MRRPWRWVAGACAVAIVAGLSPMVSAHAAAKKVFSARRDQRCDPRRFEHTGRARRKSGRTSGEHRHRHRVVTDDGVAYSAVLLTRDPEIIDAPGTWQIEDLR
jgi:hypothetical protein